MNSLKKFLLFNKKTEKNKVLNNGEIDQYREIGKLVNKARIQQNLTIQELSRISKIPERIINSIENNNKKTIPKYPFIRSILIKLEKCLELKNNTLVKLAMIEKKSLTIKEKDFLVRKFDLINTWQGTILYFLILVLTIFILKRYFVLNVNILEIQNIENKIIDK